MSTLAFVLLYGVSYGLLLCIISVGLVVTMGLMRVVNLAHGAFAATWAVTVFASFSSRTGISKTSSRKCTLTTQRSRTNRPTRTNRTIATALCSSAAPPR